MKRCPYCGSDLEDQAKFCVECGKLIPEGAPIPQAAPAKPAAAPAAPAAAQASPQAAPQAARPAAPQAAPAAARPAAPQQQKAPVQAMPAAPQAVTEASEDLPVITQMPPRNQMLSIFQYIALSLLYCLPVIGLVFLFLFGAGHPRNASLKRFSAAMLILRLLFWIVVLALAIVAMVRNGRLLSDALGQFIPAVERLIEALFA